MRVTLLRDLGAAISAVQRLPDPAGHGDAAAAHARAQQNAQPVADWLAEHPEVARVIHPAPARATARARAAKYLPRGHGGLVGFELAGGAEAGRAFIDALQMFYHVANIGDARKPGDPPGQHHPHPALAEEQLATGVTPGYVRLSIGLEHPDDMLAQTWTRRWKRPA